jgi:hypothetical protein
MSQLIADSSLTIFYKKSWKSAPPAFKHASECLNKFCNMLYCYFVLESTSVRVILEHFSLEVSPDIKITVTNSMKSEQVELQVTIILIWVCLLTARMASHINNLCSDHSQNICCYVPFLFEPSVYLSVLVSICFIIVGNFASKHFVMFDGCLWNLFIIMDLVSTYFGFSNTGNMTEIWSWAFYLCQVLAC